MTISFDSTIAKVTKDGTVVMSNSLSEGESLVSGETYQQLAASRGQTATEATDPVRPAANADKETWYEYAVSQGFTGDYNKTSKKDLVKKYGA